LFLRSSWDEDATWLGYSEGEFQLFTNGKVTAAGARPAFTSIRLGDAAVFAVSGSPPSRLEASDVSQVFLVGLRPGAAYEVEIGGEKKRVQAADAGGILELRVSRQRSVAIRLRESGRPAVQ